MKNLQLIMIAFVITVSCNNSNSKNNKMKVEYEHYNDSLTFLKLKKLKVDLNDKIFSTPNAVTNENEILNSLSKFKEFHPYDESWTFPFIYYEGPINISPLYFIKKDNFNLFFVGYSWSSTSTKTCDIFLIIIDNNGNIINFKNVAPFVIGPSDLPLILNSNFVKKYGKAGFSEIKLTHNGFQINTSLLRLFFNGTEEVTNLFYEYAISENGMITNKRVDSLTFHYFKNGILNNTHNERIVRFSNPSR